MTRIKAIVPIPMDEAGVANRASQLPAEHMGPDVQVDFEAVTFGAALGDSYYDSLLMDWTVFQTGLTAERDGYDGVLIDTVSDSGLYALRSRLSIPVIGPGQAALHTACMLGHRFSVITMWDEWFHLYKKLFNEYGIGGRCASLRSIKTRPDLAELLEGKEDVVFEKLRAAGHQAIEEDGADVIVLGSTTMHQAHAFLADALPVPVVNPGLIAFKLLTAFIDTGLTHSKRAFPAPEAPDDTQILERR